MARVEKRAVSLYRHQWAVVERIAQEDADETGDRPNISLALRRIITEHDRHRQQPSTPADKGVVYIVGDTTTEEA